MKRRGSVSNWMPVIAWMILIFAGSSDALSAEHTSRFIVPFLHWLDPTMSAATIVTVHMMIRKLGHFSEYAILAALIWRGIRGTLSISGALLALSAFFAAAVFAASDEFHQSFVPTRTASAHDVMIDCTGALFAVIVCALLSWRRNAVSVSAR
jgi:VanZ family protein